MSDFLDLSDLAPAPVKVKLPDGNLYDMLNPSAIGMVDLQRLLTLRHEGQALMLKSPPDPEDAQVLGSLLVDTAAMILPSAPREVLALLPFSLIEKLATAFFDASPKVTAPGEATPAP